MKKLVFAMILIGVLFFVKTGRPALLEPLVFCPINEWTGVLCPGCGSTRALRHLMAGEIGLAIRCNALLVFLGPFLAFLVWAEGIMEWNVSGKIGPRYIFFIVLIEALFGVFRNLPIEGAAFFRPFEGGPVALRETVVSRRHRGGNGAVPASVRVGPVSRIATGQIAGILDFPA